MTANQDDELAALRAQRLQQLQDQLHQQANQQLEAEEQAQKQARESANVDAVLRKHLSHDARARLTRIGMADPNRANAIKTDLAAMLEQGSINTPMSDAALKQVLAQLSKSRSNASVRRI